MGTGYTRNDTANNIADGNVINASDLDGEFDAVQAAFNASTGHSHDGTTGEGPQIDASGIANNAVALGTKTTGDYVASLTAGALIDLQNNSGEGATPTIDVDLTELTDMTETAVGADELVILDGGTAQKRKAISEIPLSIFNNDSSFSTTTGTVTSVGTAGTVNGITLTGTVTSSGNLTLGGTLGNITFSQLDGGAVTTSSESFADNDTTLMTSAAINDRIESFGYTTNTGDVTLAGNQTLTNKTIDVDNNTVSNIEVDNFKSGVLDTDISSVAGTDTTLASAKAIKTYVDAQVGGVSSDVVSDTSPQLGADLDLNSNNITGTGNIDNTGTVTTDGLTVAGNVSVDGGTIKLDGNYPVGTGNVALGDDAASNASLGNYNTAIGNDALKNCTGERNTAVGYNAGDAVSAGSHNTFIGENTGNNTQGTDISQCTAVGASAFEEGSGNRNTAIGTRAMMRGGASGTNSVAIGYGSQSGSESISVSNYTGGFNTSVGSTSLLTNKSGTANVAIGAGAMFAAETDCDQNVVVGNGALDTITASSSLNTVIGNGAGSTITSGQKNTILGSYNGNENSLDIRTSSNNIVLADGDGNIGYHGDSTGEVTIPGSSSSYVNSDSLSGIRMHFKNSDGTGIIGAYQSDSTVFSGYSKLAFHTSQGDGSGGTESQERMRITGLGNVGIGTASPSSPLAVAGSKSNGYAAIFNNTSSTNPYGVLIQLSGASDDDGNENFILAQDSVTTRFIVTNQGDVQNHDNSYGATSDQKLKEQITNASSQWDDIKALTVRKYKMKSDVADKGDSDNLWRLGVVAQEVETAGMSGLITETADRDDDGNDLGTTTKAVKYSVLYMKAVKALQEAMARIETLETKVAALEAGS